MVRVQEFIFTQAMVGIDLKMQVRMPPPDAGAAYIADYFSRSHQLAWHNARGVPLQVHIAVAPAVLAQHLQGNARAWIGG
jgi:hypothetical protein